MEYIYEQNIYLIYFTYGLVFFVMGFTVAIQARNYSNISNLVLAKKLWLLAAFGLTHGLVEWAQVFIPIQAVYVSQGVVDSLILIHQLVNVTSYLFLFHFGLALIKPKNLIIRNIPNILFTIWLTSFIYFILFSTVSLDWLAVSSEVWTRYLLAFPASAISSYAFILQWKSIKGVTHKKVASNFLAASIVFGVYAIVAGLIVPPASFVPATIINTKFFLNTFGIPVQLIRALSGMAMAYFVINGLEVFRIESARQIEDAKILRTVYQERGRISRDLHDGIIQSIYAVGLNLENSLYFVKDHQLELKKHIDDSMVQLNYVVKDIRNYIMNINPTNFYELNLELGVKNLITIYQEKFGIYFYLEEVKGKQSFDLSEEQRGNFYHIILEVFTNITKHSNASYVTTSIEFNKDAILCFIKDDGQGFDLSSQLSNKNKGSGQGITNMFERAESLKAKLDIESSPQKGTSVSINIFKGGNANG